MKIIISSIAGLIGILLLVTGGILLLSGFQNLSLQSAIDANPYNEILLGCALLAFPAACFFFVKAMHTYGNAKPDEGSPNSPLRYYVHLFTGSFFFMLLVLSLALYYVFSMTS